MYFRFFQVYTTIVEREENYFFSLTYFTFIERKSIISTTFFGFALADSMFQGDCEITRKTLTIDEVKELIDHGVTPCLNPSHVATISAMEKKFSIHVEIPATPPRVVVNSGDSVIVMGVRGLPRLTDRHEYTDSVNTEATFSFSIYTVK